MKYEETENMKPTRSDSIFNMGRKVVALTTMIGIVIGIIGFFNKWNSSVAYSNAFFLAGCLLIIAGGFSSYAASQEIRVYQRIPSNAFRGMSSRERAHYVVDTSSSISAFIFGTSSGIILIFISAILMYIL